MSIVLLFSFSFMIFVWRGDFGVVFCVCVDDFLNQSSVAGFRAE